MGDFLVIFNGIVGLFATYSAIKGDGAAYKNEYPDSVKPAHNAFLRKIFWILGPFLIITAVLEYFKVLGNYTIYLSYFTIIVVLAVVVFYVVYTKKHFQAPKK